MCANKVGAGERCRTLVPNIRPVDRCQFTSARQIIQLEGLAVAIPWGSSPPSAPPLESITYSNERPPGNGGLRCLVVNSVVNKPRADVRISSAFILIPSFGEAHRPAVTQHARDSWGGRRLVDSVGISWSLRELTRDGRTSGTNAMLAIVLSDAVGSYDYAVVENTCPSCYCRTWQTHAFFRSRVSDSTFA